MKGIIQTLHHRAPEVLLSLPYDKAIDVWSFGCSIFEIAVVHVLFHGEDELDQISRIMEVLGHFPNYMIEGKMSSSTTWKLKEGLILKTTSNVFRQGSEVSQ